jgi:hypothetical protein
MSRPDFPRVNLGCRWAAVCARDNPGTTKRRFERPSLYVAGLAVHKEREKRQEKLEGPDDDRMGWRDRYASSNLKSHGLRSVIAGFVRELHQLQQEVTLRARLDASPKRVPARSQSLKASRCLIE